MAFICIIIQKTSDFSNNIKGIRDRLSVMASIHSESVDRLFEAVLGLESLDECYDFFSDICTIKEVLDMAQRLDTAILLENGASYQEISREIGISTATIGRVSRCLNYGSGGYRTAIKKLETNGGENKNEI